MALTLIASVAGDGTTSAINTTGADLIVLVVAGGSFTLTATDSKSNTWTGLTQRHHTSDNDGRLLYCYAPTVGSGHTFTAPHTYETVAVLAFSGAKTSPFDTENGNIGSSPLSTGSITPSEDNCVVVAGFGLGGNCNTFSIDGSFTGLTSNTAVSGSTYGAAIAYLIQTTAAAANPALTYSGGGGGNAMIASFKAASGGGGGTTTEISSNTSNATGSISSKSTAKPAIAATTANTVGTILSKATSK